MPPGLTDALRNHEGFSAIYTNLCRVSGARLVPLACVEWIVPPYSEKLMCLITGSRLDAALQCRHLPIKHDRPQNPAFIFFRLRDIKQTWMTELNPKQRLQGWRTDAWIALEPPPTYPRPAGERFGRGLGSFHQVAWQKLC